MGAAAAVGAVEAVRAVSGGSGMGWDGRKEVRKWGSKGVSNCRIDQRKINKNRGRSGWLVVVVVVDELTSEYVLTRRASANLCIPAFQSSSLLIFQSSNLPIFHSRDCLHPVRSNCLGDVQPAIQHASVPKTPGLYLIYLSASFDPRSLTMAGHITSHHISHLTAPWMYVYTHASLPFFRILSVLIAFLRS